MLLRISPLAPLAAAVAAALLMTSCLRGAAPAPQRTPPPPLPNAAGPGDPAGAPQEPPRPVSPAKTPQEAVLQAVLTALDTTVSPAGPSPLPPSRWRVSVSPTGEPALVPEGTERSVLALAHLVRAEQAWLQSVYAAQTPALTQRVEQRLPHDLRALTQIAAAGTGTGTNPPTTALTLTDRLVAFDALLRAEGTNVSTLERDNPAPGPMDSATVPAVVDRLARELSRPAAFDTGLSGKSGVPELSLGIQTLGRYAQRQGTSAADKAAAMRQVQALAKRLAQAPTYPTATDRAYAIAALITHSRLSGQTLPRLGEAFQHLSAEYNATDGLFNQENRYRTSQVDYLAEDVAAITEGLTEAIRHPHPDAPAERAREMLDGFLAAMLQRSGLLTGDGTPLPGLPAGPARFDAAKRQWTAGMRVIDTAGALHLAAALIDRAQETSR